MYKKIFLLGLGCLFFLNVKAQNTEYKQDSLAIRRIYDEALSRGQCYDNLRVLCKSIGARLSGSPQAEKAVFWGQEVMRKAGFDSVWLQPVKVPHWVRGNKEEGKIVLDNKNQLNVPVCALGGSVGTPASGLKAQVIEVQNFEELASLGESKVKGKIVFFNRPMDEKLISTFRAYGGCVNQRYAGAMHAAKYGAVGVIVRSMTLKHDEYPHTGSMGYVDSLPQIPAAAIATSSADLLHKHLGINPKVSFYLNLSCQLLPDVDSYNVIGELEGSTNPLEYIVVGGHLDSWDKGEGAHDDGAGIVHSIEAVRLFKAVGIRPKHTLRAVLYMNEENGAKGAAKYAKEAEEKFEKHLYAIESDAGGFSPRGISIDTDNKAEFEKMMSWKPLFEPYQLTDIEKGGSGVDVGFLKKQTIGLMGLSPDSQRYFDHHHADTDVFEAVHQRELELGAAACAAWMYMLDKYAGQ
ncbi:MAG: M20/M25/M40 family metallo-hydrolase [Bacteroidia bacterium]